MNAHLIPNACFKAISISSIEAKPPSWSLTASLRRAPCNLFKTKPSASLFTVIAAYLAFLYIETACLIIFGSVFTPPATSTNGTIWGGKAGWALIHLYLCLTSSEILEIRR